MNVNKNLSNYNKILLIVDNKGRWTDTFGTSALLPWYIWMACIFFLFPSGL